MIENWDLVRDFLAIYREGSVTRAAKGLGVQQSTISRRIVQLEEQLGVQLFFRVQGGMEVTDAGLALVRDAENTEDSMAKLAMAARGTREQVLGVVRVAAPLGIAQRVFLPMCKSIYEQHPQIRINIIAGVHTLDLTRGEADIALRFVKPSAGDLMAKPVADLDFGVLAHREYRRAHRTKNPDKLDWIGMDTSLALTPEYVWTQKSVGVPPRLVCNDFTLVFDAIRNGLGVGLLPRAMLQGNPELVEVKLGLPMPAPMRLWLVMHRSLRHIGKYAAVWSELLRRAQLGKSVAVG